MPKKSTKSQKKIPVRLYKASNYSSPEELAKVAWKDLQEDLKTLKERRI